MNEVKDDIIHQIYYALEKAFKYCQEYEDLKEYPGKEIKKIMQDLTRKLLKPN